MNKKDLHDMFIAIDEYQDKMVTADTIDKIVELVDDAIIDLCIDPAEAAFEVYKAESIGFIEQGKSRFVANKKQTKK